MATPTTTLTIGGRDVVITNPDKVYFAKAGITKLDIARYYVDVGAHALLAMRARPMILKRFVNGIDEVPFFQKRAPKNTPPWIRTATLRYASGGHADEICAEEVAAIAWVVNLGCVEMHVHPIRMDDLDKPDELRIDLDPVEGVQWPQVVEVAQAARGVLDDLGYVGYPKTSGSRGVHIWVRTERKHNFDVVRHAAQALAREIERRAPTIATSVWRKEERHGVLVDYNQNAFDRTTAAAWSVRATQDARVSMPLTWDDLAACNPADFTLKTAPALAKKNGDPHAKIDERAFSLDALLELAAKEPKPAKPPRGALPKKRLPVIVIARAPTKPEVTAGLERWRAKYPDVAKLLAAEDVITDAMRGRSSPWFRIRINLKSVPPELWPPPEPPDPDFEPPDPRMPPPSA